MAEVKIDLVLIARTLNELQKVVHENSKNHGFWDYAEVTPELQASKIALIHSELSEALEAVRDKNPPDKHLPGYSNLEVELADAVIRILDLAEASGLKVGSALLAKHLYNKNRPVKHGRSI